MVTLVGVLLDEGVESDSLVNVRDAKQAKDEQRNDETLLAHAAFAWSALLLFSH
jgi:hypothetical protein